MRTLNFEPESAAEKNLGRPVVSRKVPAAMAAFLMTLVIATGPATGSDQFASLEVPSYGTLSEGLDLGSLEAKIRNTDAMDLFAKISLKSELSSLMDEVARCQLTKNAAGLKQQRARLEKLIDETVALLRKGDVSLADEVNRSRDAVWSFLNRPERQLAAANLDNDGQND